MKDIYLGLWKNLSYLETTERAAIILALKPVCFLGILLLIFSIRRTLIRLFFSFIYKVHELISFRKSFEARATANNRISERYETIYSKMNTMHIKRWIFRILLVLTAYYLARVAIIVYEPQLTDSGKQTYLGSFVSSQAQKYHQYETKMLQMANEYQPLIPVDSQSIKQIENLQNKTNQSKEKSWLSLSKKGRKRTDVRKKPNKKSKKITSVSGKDKVLFLVRKKGWVKIQLKNGKQGWISQASLENIPQ